MYRSLTCLACLLGMAGCMQTNAGTSKEVAKINNAKTVIAADASYTSVENGGGNAIGIDSALHAKLNWADSLVKDAVTLSGNPQVQYAIKDNTLTWLWDRLLHTDTAQYIVLHLGHDFEDEDGRRFITDGWLYIDTLTRNVYEYDLPNDSLIWLENNFHNRN